MKIKISADSTCDLPRELIEKYDIGIVPLYIVMNDRPLRDGIDITPQDIFDAVAAGGEIGSTAAVNTSEYIERFSEYLKDYDAVVHINLSSEISVCYQNATIAAKEFDNVYTVDSRSLSTGSGHLVLDACELAAEGVDAAEIKAILDERQQKLDVSFVLDTLDYLRRGGRCSSLTAIGANLLHIKPCIEVRDGKMGVGRKYRGTLEKTLSAYITDRLSGRDDIDFRRIFITHSGVDEAVVDELEALVRSLCPFETVLRSRAGCTISNHCGPLCLGILFYTK